MSNRERSAQRRMRTAWRMWLSFTTVSLGMAWLAAVLYPLLGYPGGPTLVLLSAAASVPSASAQRMGGVLPFLLGVTTTIAAVVGLLLHVLGRISDVTTVLVVAAIFATLTLIVGPIHARRSDPTNC